MLFDEEDGRLDEEMLVEGLGRGGRGGDDNDLIDNQMRKFKSPVQDEDEEGMSIYVCVVGSLDKKIKIKIWIIMVWMDNKFDKLF
jgi:hypothetical protein